MDYSTISNRTTLTETEELTGGELSERYYLLKKQYDNLSSNFDAIKQELHDTRRSYQTALDVQSHLNAELESYQVEEEKRRNELLSRISALQDEISTLRSERSQICDQNTADIKKLEAENRRLKEEQAVACKKTPERDNNEVDDLRAKLSSATSEAATAKATLEQAKCEIASWRLKVDELVSEMGELRAAADIRREEIRSVVEREAAALADLAEARAMLHQMDSPDLQPHAAKGNSIFAEVEDKRQEMAKNLIQMKQSNARLRRDLANKQAEIDALIHEKNTIWEQQVGASAHYDRELIESYEERITQLEAVCERQRRELCRWAGRADAAAAPGAGWLPAVLHHLRSECERLRAEVLSQGAAQLASAAQVRSLRRSLALAAHAPRSPPHAHAHAHADAGADADVDAGVTGSVGPKMPFRPINVHKGDEVKRKVSFNLHL